MTHSRFMGSLFCAALVFFLTSCGGSGNDKTTVKDSTATDTAVKTSAAKPAISTIITAPQNMLIITHKVANYAKWKTGYDAHDSVRLAHGIHNYVIGRGVPDSNMITIALKIDDTAKAMSFVKDPGLKTVMQKVGVIGKPTISFVTETWQDTAIIDSKLRSRTMFAVKDWDAWQKGFEDGKQERIDNGITVRVIGHDLRDNKKVFLVTALLDTAKAFVYYKSDALKKRREASGVIGQPVRFLFRIAQHY
jgi:hypothetical protein